MAAAAATCVEGGVLLGEVLSRSEQRSSTSSLSSVIRSRFRFAYAPVRGRPAQHAMTTTPRVDIERHDELMRYLRDSGRIGLEEQPEMCTLEGGVSNRTVLVQRQDGERDRWRVGVVGSSDLEFSQGRPDGRDHRGTATPWRRSHLRS